MTKYLVRIPGAYALLFHRNLCLRRAFSAVPDRDATQFDTAWEAELKAREWGLSDYYVDPLPEETPTSGKVVPH